jgi:hypothetical protein
LTWPTPIKRRTYVQGQAPPLIEEMPKPPRVRDLTGQQFGKWTVLGYHGRKTYAQKDSIADYWRCKCECGTEASVQGRSLQAETSRQCVVCSKGNPFPPSWKKWVGG